MSKLTPEEALRGGKSIRLGDVEAMLREHGFVEKPGRLNWQHSKYQDLILAINPREREIDTGALKEAGEMCIKAVKRQENERDASSSKNEKLPSWLKLPEGYSGEMHGEKITLRPQDYPELPMIFTVRPNERNAIGAFQRAFELHKDMLARYKQKAAELETNYGFQFIRDAGLLTIKQEDYGVERTYPINGGHGMLQALLTAEREAEDVYVERQAKLDELAIRGFGTEKLAPVGVDTPARITHPKLAEPVEITLHGPLERIDREGLTKIDAALAAVSAEVKAPAVPEPVAASATVAATSSVAGLVASPASAMAAGDASASLTPPSSPKYYRREKSRTLADYQPNLNKPVLPKEQKLSLVLDTNMLIDLSSADRRGGRTWIDLLPVIADSPAIDKIYISSTVADWESLRRVSYWDDKGKLAFDQVSNNHKKDRAARRELLDTATRQILDQNGNVVREIPGKNPHIVICETPFDRAFMTSAHRILNTDIGVSEKLRGIVNLAKNIENSVGERGKKGQIGELSMEELAKLIKGQPVHTMSLDSQYFINRTDSLVTQDGYPIGDARLPALLEAAFKADFHGIKKKLNDSFDVDVGELTVDRVKRDIVAAGGYTKTGKYPETFAGNPGTYMTRGEWIPGETLESIFARGAAAARGEPYKFTMPRPGAPIQRREPVPATSGDRMQIPPVVPAVTIAVPSARPDGADAAAVVASLTPPSPPVAAEPTSATSIKTTARDERAAEVPYEETLGYHIGSRRIERGMHEGQLAEAVNKITGQRHEIDHMTVRRWETNRELPHDEVYDALVTVLIDENDKFSDKDQARTQFKAAYEKAKSAFQNKRDGKTFSEGDMFAFTDLLYDFTIKAGLTNIELAQKISEKTHFHIEEKPEDVNAELMLRIAANDHRPSLGLMRAIVKALDDVKPLQEHEKQGIFDAYQQGAKKGGFAAAVVTSVERGEDTQQERDSARKASELKYKIRDLFRINGVQIPLNRIGTMVADESKGQRVLNSAEMSHLLGAGAKLTGFSREWLIKTGKQLRDNVLAKVNSGALPEFDSLYPQYLDAVDAIRPDDKRKAR